MSRNAEFEYSAEDNVDAVRAHTGRSSMLISMLFLLIAAFSIWVDWRKGLSIIDDLVVWLTIGCFLFFLVWDRIRDWSVRRNFRQSSRMRTPVRLSWDSEAVIFDTDLSHARYPWADFHRWLGSKKTLLLYRDSSFFFPVPRRVLSDGAYEEMVAMLRASGVREKGKPQSAQSSPMSR